MPTKILSALFSVGLLGAMAYGAIVWEKRRLARRVLAGEISAESMQDQLQLTQRNLSLVPLGLGAGLVAALFF